MRALSACRRIVVAVHAGKRGGSYHAMLGPLVLQVLLCIMLLSRRQRLGDTNFKSDCAQQTEQCLAAGYL